jgi:hypothetical protein
MASDCWLQHREGLRHHHHVMRWIREHSIAIPGNRVKRRLIWYALLLGAVGQG